MHRLLVASVVVALALIAPAGIMAAPTGSTDAKNSTKVFDKRSAVITFKAMPLSTYDGHIKGYEKTSPSKGKLNLKSAASTKYLGYLKTQHSAFQKWLQKNVPSAKITSSYYVTLNGVAVKLNGSAIGKLANSAYVQSVQYTTLYHPDMSESHKIINAGGAWSQAGGRAGAGAGIKIGDIDTGIDETHPFFDPSGFNYPSTGTWPKCDAADSTTHTVNSHCKYVSPKVIVAKVFYNKAAVSGLDAQAIQDHGTHTAGTAAGVTGKTAHVNGVAIDDMSGIAPGAWLGNYNVFPGDLLSSRSEDILNAVEAAVKDGMDVLNLSLGGSYHGNNDLLAAGVDNAVAAGVVVAISAGNEGPGAGTIGSPGRARNVITAGASSNQHFVGQPFTYGSTTVGAAVGDFPALPTATYTLAYAPSTNLTACTTAGITGATGKLLVVNRGTCTFSTKDRTAIAVGAVGLLVINNVAGDPAAMAQDGLGGDDLPAVQIGKAEGAALRTAAPTTASAVATIDEIITDNADILAGFSSQGPTNVDLNIKPDLTSVGVNVLSSITTIGKAGGEDIWAFFSGTSMAAPHIAGSAAVLLDLHPGWSPAKVKSALVNTADRVVLDAFGADHLVGPRAQGAGREDLTEAANAEITFWPIAASFGQISGSQTDPTSMTITLTNLTGTDKTLSVSEHRFTPVAVGSPATTAWGAGDVTTGDSRITTPTTITVPGNGTAQLVITVHAGLNKQTVQGWIDLSGTAGDYTFAYMAFVP
jgi:minor extracellular serine protease Vpr